MLPVLETRRLGQIDRRSAHDDIGTVQKPVLQGTVELEQDTLLGYIAVPVKHHTSAIARQVECETSHGIGVMHMDDVVLPTDALERAYHRRADHRGGQFAPGRHPEDACMLIDLKLPTVIPHGSTKHVASNSPFRQSTHQVNHHPLNSPLYREELTKL